MEHVLEFLGKCWLLWLLLFLAFLYLAWRRPGNKSNEMDESPLCLNDEVSSQTNLFVRLALLAFVLLITGVLHRL